MVAKCPLPKAILAELYERRLQWIYLESCYSTLRLPSSRRAAHRHIGEFISEVQAKPSTERLTLYKEKLRTLERYASWRSLRPLRRLGAISRQSWRADRSPQSPAAHIQNLFSEHRMLEIVALYQANPACRVWNDSDIALLGVQAAEMAGCPGLLLPLAAKQLARDGVDPRICFAVLRPIAAREAARFTAYMIQYL